MNSSEDHYQLIGQELVLATPEGVDKALVYAEVENGVVAVGVFYLLPDNRIRYVQSTPELRDALYSFWEDGSNAPDGSKWDAVTFLIDGGRFHAELTYSEQMDLKKNRVQRREVAVRKYLGTGDILYGT